MTTANPAELTATFWDFTGQGSLPSINFISITLTLQDGNTAMGEFDFNRVFLALDGINTGLAINGFRGGGLEDTLTISGSLSPAVSNMLSIQLTDGMLVGTLIRPGDAIGAPPNDIFVGNDAGNAMTTLVLAVPEPATFVLLGAGLLLFIGPQVRRFRRNL